MKLYITITVQLPNLSNYSMLANAAEMHRRTDSILFTNCSHHQPIHNSTSQSHLPNLSIHF